MNSAFEQVRTTLYAVWRKRWYGLAAMWAVCLVGWVVIALIPNEYRSDARIYVKWSSLLPEKLGFGAGDKLRQIDVVRQTLTSRPNLEKVIGRSDLDIGVSDDAELETMINKMAETIQVKSQQDNLFTISWVANDPERAQRVVQNLINIFVEDNISSDRDSLNQAMRFMEDQISERERQLEQAESRRAQFEQQYLGRMPGDGDIGTRLQTAQTELEKVNQELVQAQGALRALNAQLSSTPATIDAPAFFFEGPAGPIGARYDPTSARGRIEVLERQVSDAYARGWTDQHPDIVAARKQIERLRTEADNEAKDEAKKANTPSKPSRPAAAQANPVYVNLKSLLFEKQSSVASLSARRGQLERDIADLASKQVEQPGIAAEQARINRDYNVLKSQYEELLKSREEIRLRADVENKTDQIQFQIVDPPSLSRTPVAPDRPLLLTAVLLAGLGAGVAVAFLMTQLHTTYLSPAKLSSDMGLPVLGSVGEIVDPASRALRRRWLVGFGAITAGLFGLFAVLLTWELVRNGGAV